jgi:DNA polymerase-4
MIVHLDIDAFFASVEQILVPALRGRPVAVGSGCVASCNYRARRFGVRAGMSLAEARERCPDLAVQKGSYPVYRCFAARVWDLCREVAPAVDTYLDDAYMDMSGTEKLYPNLPGRVGDLRERVRAETGLTATAGIGPNRMIARLAGKSAKPDGLRLVAPGDVEDFIAARPVGDIPGVGRRTGELLGRINVRSVRELRRLPRRTLVDLCGRNGAVLYERARGRDTRAVSKREVPSTISRETTFHAETADPAEVRAMLHYLVERAVRGARALGVVASRAGLRLRYGDFQGEEATRRLPRPTDLEKDVFAAATALLERLWTRRVALRLVGVTLSGLSLKHAEQFDLFEPPDERAAALAAAVDEVRARFGFSAITAGPSLDLLGKLRRETDGYVLRTPCLTK